MDIKIVRLKGSKEPAQGKPQDYAYDVVATSCEEIAPNTYRYNLGIKLQIDRTTPLKLSEGATIHYTKAHQSVSFDPAVIDLKTSPLHFCFHLYPRSSAWKHGMMLTNSVGTIDEGYTGEITAVFFHYNTAFPKYEVGDKIGQIALEASLPMDFISALILEETDRSSDKEGSTGK